MRFTKAELAAYRDQTLPDLAPDPIRLLIVGINPSLWSAAASAHFARPGNRYYPALYAAGITPWLIDASQGYRREDLDLLARLGIGNTNLVARATARADELSRDELRRGRRRLEQFVAQHRPAVVAVAGVTAYRTAFGVPKAVLGEQPERLAGTRLFVVPNPSGLNAHETIASLGRWYRDAALAAGVPVGEPRD